MTSVPIGAADARIGFRSNAAPNDAVDAATVDETMPAGRDIAMFVYSLRGGGAERVCALLADGLQANGYRVTMITELGPETDQHSLSPSIRRVVIGGDGEGGNVVSKAGRMVGKVRRLRRALKQGKPDVLISLMTRCNNLAVAAANGLPCRTIISERNDPRYRAEPVIDRALRSLLYRRADLLVAQTPVVEAIVRQKFKVSRTLCIPNPIMSAAAQPGAIAAARPGRGYILGMGRLNAQKGFDTLIEAYARSTARHTLDLVIAGQGADRDALNRLATTLGVGDRVDLVGYVERPMQLMAGCRMFVLSSRYEGFPNVLLEAMDLGRPVISTRLPSGAHAVIEDGDSGLLVPVDDSAAMAAAIDLIGKSDALSAHLGEAARRAVEPFQVREVISMWRRAIHLQT